jgi:hypothetical protein
VARDAVALRGAHHAACAVPRLTTVGVISNPRNAAFSDAMAQAMSGAAKSLGLQLQVFDAPDVRAYPTVVSEIAARRGPWVSASRTLGAPAR